MGSTPVVGQGADVPQETRPVNGGETSEGDESLHILVLTDRDWMHPQGGGTGTNLFGQVTRWLAWGHRVSVIASNFPGGAEFERHGGLTLYRMGGRSTVFPHAIYRQWRSLVADADVVLEIINGITFLTPIWLRTPRVALIHHIHREHYVAELGRPGALAAFCLETAPLRWLYRNARFITVSRATADDVATHGVPREHIAVNYNGVELDAFQPGIKTAEPTLLVLGRLKRYKRIELVLDALTRVPVGTLHIAGDGDHREAVEAAIMQRGLEARVHMHGSVDEPTKLRLLQESWVNVTASACEGWGLTVTEAGACRTPTVATAAGGLAESVIEGETGVLVEDAAGMAVALRQLIDDAAYRNRLGDAAYERAHGLTWERTAATTLAALHAERKRAASKRSALRQRSTVNRLGRSGRLVGAVAITDLLELLAAARSRTTLG
jgi:glycosyltransferase involved in cell wall biosynthesis